VYEVAFDKQSRGIEWPGSTNLVEGIHMVEGNGAGSVSGIFTLADLVRLQDDRAFRPYLIRATDGGEFLVEHPRALGWWRFAQCCIRPPSSKYAAMCQGVLKWGRR
jgi:hypothetical protein